MLKKVPNFVLASKNPQPSPEATPPVFFRLQPHWMAFVSILLNWNLFDPTILVERM